MNPTEELLSKLKALLGIGVDATEADAKDLEARAKEAGLRTKASDVGTDVDAGTKALEAVKALEVKVAEATATIGAQAAQITALQASIQTSDTAQKAHQGRAEKAIKDVADLLVVLNAKPELSAPPQQAQLAAVEAATKAKVDAAMSPEGLAPLAKLQRYTYNPDGTTVATPLH